MSDVTDTLRGPWGTDLDRAGQTVASAGSGSSHCGAQAEARA